MSDLSLTQHTGLAFLLSQHSSETVALDATKTDTIIIRNASPSEKGKKAAKLSTGEQAAPIHDKPAVFGVVMPEKGTLDAKGFLKAMLNAGRRISEHGTRFTDSREVRNDQIKAIAAYIGYNVRESFGSQDTAARAQASRELSGKIPAGPTREEARAAARSLTGFVAGLPSHMQRMLADLQGREQAAVDAALDHTRDANNPKRSTADRLLSAGLAEVERERLHAIRNDIKSFGF